MKKELRLLKKIYHDLFIEKHACSWDEEPHYMAECKDARCSIKVYLEGLIDKYKKEKQ